MEAELSIEYLQVLLKAEGGKYHKTRNHGLKSVKDDLDDAFDTFTVDNAIFKYESRVEYKELKNIHFESFNNSRIVYPALEKKWVLDQEEKI